MIGPWGNERGTGAVLEGARALRAGGATGVGGASTLLGTLLLCAALLLVDATALSAQDPPPPPDSTRIRLQQRLSTLARGLANPDTTAAVDTLPTARGPIGGAVVTFPSDAVIDSLLALPGFRATEYSGLSAIFETSPDGTRLRLFGSGTPTDTTEAAAEPVRAMVLMGGGAVRADSVIDYDERTGRGTAIGSPVSSQEGQDPLSSETLVFDTERLAASAMNANTVYRVTGTEWILAGDLPLYEGEIVFGDDMSFTTCSLSEPHYHFRAGQIKIHAGNVLVARNVTLNFAGVPVLWLPFIAQSTKSGRRSGILTPRFSVNDIVRTSGGYSRRIEELGFYWAMSEYADASLAYDWFSGQYKALNGRFRYNWARQFLDGSGSVKQYWRDSGGTEITLSTRHTWDPDERTTVQFTGSYASSTQLITSTTFDPREVTRSIDSSGGIDRTFDWGTVSAAFSRQQYLSDDKVVATLPKVSITPRAISLWGAAPANARFYNNATLSMSGSFERRTTDLAQFADSAFTFRGADDRRESARTNASLAMGGFTLSGTANYADNILLAVPDSIFPDAAPDALGFRDLSQAEVTWSGSLSYQIGLPGSTTLTPNVGVSSRFLRSDTISDAQSFVSAPKAINFGAGLRTDLYRVFPGIAGYEAIRHKVTPSVDFSYSPARTPTDLQRQIFGARDARKIQTTSLTLNQTFEAKPRAPEEGEEEEPGEAAGAAAEGPRIGELVLEQDRADSLAALGQAPPVRPAVGRRGAAGLDDSGLTRIQSVQPITVLAISTSAIRYDWVEADSTGRFVDGFQSTTLSNTIRSDLLRGLTLQIEHDLFGDDDGGARTFSPKLTRLNAGFSLEPRSWLVRVLGLGPDGAEDPATEAALDAAEEEGFEEEPVRSRESMIPDADEVMGGGDVRTASGGQPGVWRLGLNYSLLRPRSETARAGESLSINASFNPTQNWQASWTTSYDVTNSSFTDHNVSLIRRLHRWQAEFGFLQTATGNWSFNFQVSLTDNRDLQFDYQQRDLRDGSFGGQR